MAINADGSFLIAAKVPTLLGGDPVSGRQGDTLKLTLMDDQVYSTITKTTKFEQYHFFRLKITDDMGHTLPYSPVNSELAPMEVSILFDTVVSVTVEANTLNMSTAKKVLSQEQKNISYSQLLNCQYVLVRAALSCARCRRRWTPNQVQ